MNWQKAPRLMVFSIRTAITLAYVTAVGALIATPSLAGDNRPTQRRLQTPRQSIRLKSVSGRASTATTSVPPIGVGISAAFA